MLFRSRTIHDAGYLDIKYTILIFIIQLFYYYNTNIMFLLSLFIENYKKAIDKKSDWKK